MPVRLRGRKQRANKEKRGLQPVEVPEVEEVEEVEEEESVVVLTEPRSPAEPSPITPPDHATSAGAPANEVVYSVAQGEAAQAATEPVAHFEPQSLSVEDSPSTTYAAPSPPGQPPEPSEEGEVPSSTSYEGQAPAVASHEGADFQVADLGEVQVQAGDYVPRPTPRVIAVANQKGGVGKTTTAVNLGAALAELGYRTLIVDLDPQANATTGVGIDARSFDLSMYDVLMRDVKIEDAVEPTSMRNLFVAPATIDLAGAEIELVPAFSRELKLRRALEAIAGDFHYTLVDCPPSLGLITVNGLAAADEVLVPIQCEYYALEGLGQLLRNVQLVKTNLNEKLEVSTIVLTMYDGRTKLAEQVVEEVRSHFGNKVCRNVIPRNVRISEAPSYGQPITAFDPGSRGAIAYRELAREVSGGAA